MNTGLEKVEVKNNSYSYIKFRLKRSMGKNIVEILNTKETKFHIIVG